MELKKILDVFEQNVPHRYSDKLVEMTDGYDNSGLILKCGNEVHRALFSLDFSEKAVEKAIKEGADLIVTHHPAIYRPISSVSEDDSFGRAFIKAVKAGISVFSMHLNLDVAPYGVDDNLAKIFGENGKILVPVEEGVGYGRLTETDATLKELADRYEKATGSKRVIFYGDPAKKIRKTVSFCGSGGDAPEIKLALSLGADLMVSSDFKHHNLTEAVQNGLAVLAVTHYSAEAYGFSQFFEYIQNKLEGLPVLFWTDEALL